MKMRLTRRNMKAAVHKQKDGGSDSTVVVFDVIPDFVVNITLMFDVIPDITLLFVPDTRLPIILVFELIFHTIAVAFDVIPGKWNVSEISIFYQHKMEVGGKCR